MDAGRISQLFTTHARLGLTRLARNVNAMARPHCLHVDCIDDMQK